MKNQSYVRNGHLTGGLERFLLPVVSAVLRTWYKQQLQHAHTMPNADTPLADDLNSTPTRAPHPKLKTYLNGGLKSFLLLSNQYLIKYPLVSRHCRGLALVVNTVNIVVSYQCTFYQKYYMEYSGLKELNSTCLHLSHTIHCSHDRLSGHCVLRT